MSALNVDLTGKVAVVTGAASGIGRATAIRLAQNGARVFTGDYQPNDETSREFASLGIEESRCDVRHVDQLQKFIDQAATRSGRLDILVNNAGVVFVKPVTEVAEQEWDRVIDTNLKAAFFGSKYAIRHMIPSGGGVIINMASNAGILPRAHDPVYSISKMALVGLTKSIALSHSLDRIRVNCICPGPVDGTQIMQRDLENSPDPEASAARFIQASPLARAEGRMIHPEEVAEAVLYLVSDAAKMVTGTAIAIDGGKSLGVPPADPAQ